MIDCTKLEVVDHLRSGALVVAFIAVLAADVKGRNGRGRKNMWVNAEVVAFFFTGLACLIFPTTFLEYFTRTSLSAAHVHAMRILSVVFFVTCFTTARLQGSLENDGVVHANWLINRLMMSGCLLFSMIQTNQDLDVFTEQHKSFVILGVGLWFAGCVWQLFTSEQLGGGGALRNLRSPANIILIVIAAETFISSIIGLAYPAAGPKMILTVKLDSLGLHLMQQISIFRLFMGMRCVGALFSTEFCKKQLILGFAVGMPLFLGLVVWTQYSHQMYTRSGLVWLAVVVPIQAVLLYHGYYRDDNDKKSR